MARTINLDLDNDGVPETKAKAEIDITRSTLSIQNKKTGRFEGRTTTRTKNKNVTFIKDKTATLRVTSPKNLRGFIGGRTRNLTPKQIRAIHAKRRK